MTNAEAMLAECLDEVEEVLLSYRHRRLQRDNAWGSTICRAFQLDGRTVTMNLTIDVTAPAPVHDHA